MKISGNSSNRTKISSKPSSASRQEAPTFIHQSAFLKNRRGSTLTTCSNQTTRYVLFLLNISVCDKNDSSRFNSLKKAKDECRTSSLSGPGNL